MGNGRQLRSGHGFRCLGIGVATALLCLTSLGATSPWLPDRPELPSAGDEPAALSLPTVPGRVLVRFRSGVGSVQKAGLLSGSGVTVKALRSFNRNPVQVRAAAQPSTFDQLHVVTLDRPADTARLLARLARDPNVVYAEPDRQIRIFNALPSRPPNDFLFTKLWNLENTGQTEGTPGADIKAVDAWAITTGSRAVRVAVIDTGIDYFHPDLAGNIWTNPREIPGNGLDDDRNGFVDDVHGYDFVSDDSDPFDDQAHGTHVAGTIGALGNNRIGVTGVCWEVSLMAIKAFDDRGYGTLSSVIDSLAYAAANGAHIINASWGQPDKSRALADAIAAAHEAGVIIVAAAGNDRNDLLSYPAAYPESITVAALDHTDRRAGFSNFGAFVDVSAPGENILSTIPDNRYELFSGTSMAAPHVAGVAALILGQHPEFTQRDVETILGNAVDPIVADRPIGAGRLNAAKAVRIRTPLPEARLRVPERLAGTVDLSGTAMGPRFANYRLQFGAGAYPTNWTDFHFSNTPVTNGVLLAGLTTDTIPEGEQTLRLIVTDTLGQEAADRAVVQVQNVRFAAPLNNDVRRAGDRVELRGNVFGTGRTYAVEHGVGWQPTTWSTQGVTLADDGQLPVLDGPLGVWDTTSAPTNSFHTLRLTAFNRGEVVGQVFARMIYLDGRLRPGWPKYFEVAGDYPTNDWRDVKVADLDADGRAEIIAVVAGSAAGQPTRLVVMDSDGPVRWTRELGHFEPYHDLPVIGDLDGDGTLEVIADAGEERLIHAFHADGSTVAGRWPVEVEAGTLGKVLADLDGDGRLELIAYSNETGADRRHLYVFDAGGNRIRHWILGQCEPDRDTPKMLPAIANLDADRDLEIVAVRDCQELAAFDLAQPDEPLWTNRIAGHLIGSPVVADLNGDGRNEIIFCSHDPQPSGRTGDRGGVHVLDQGGKSWAGWPVLTEHSLAGTPALADFDGDGQLEIVVANWEARLLHLLRATGFEADGWPVELSGSTTLRTNPVLGDVDGDGRPDVVVVTPGRYLLTVSSGTLGTVGGVKAWNFAGQPVDLDPHPQLDSLVMESAGGSQRLKAAPPVLADLDGDGRLEVVASTVDDVSYSPTEPRSTRKQRYSIYAWDLGTPFDPEVFPWPMFQRDPAQTGYWPPPFLTNHPPVAGHIPSQTIRVGDQFLPVRLDEYVEDQDHALDSLVWSVEGVRELRVTLDPERILVVQTPTSAWTGSETLRFVVRDPAGFASETVAVFSARTDYHPPVANEDAVGTEEDTPVDIAPLANDRHPLGRPLQLTGFSRPRHGTVARLGPDLLRYQPSPDYHGDDAFTYTLSDGTDGLAQGRVGIAITPVEDLPIAEPDTAITDEDLPVEIEVLANDHDGDDDPLTLVNFGLPEHGTLSPDASGRLVYRPAPDWFGNDGFRYQITDGNGNFAEADVRILVKPVNDAPVAPDQELVINRNTERDIFYQAVDPDGDELSYRLVAAPLHAEVWSYPRIATYRPHQDYSGLDSMSYVADDGVTESREATIHITVTDENNPPEVGDLDTATKVGRPLPLGLEARDRDEEPVLVELVTLPTHGVLEGTGTNYTYYPEATYVGADRFTFRASDGQAWSREAVVTLRLTDQNTPPRAREAALQVRLNTATNLVLRADDDENDPLTFRILTPPAAGQLSGTPPDLLYTPLTDYLGPDKVVFRADDGEAESEPETVFIEVVQPNQAATIRDQTLSVPIDHPTLLRLEVSDQDNDLLQGVILKGPRSGRLFGSGTNFTYVPKPGFAGADSFTYRVWDGLAYSAVARVSLNVDPPPPLAGPVFTKVERRDGGVVRLHLELERTAQVRIEASDDLREWILLATLQPPGTTLAYDDVIADRRTRFYRAVQAP